MEMELMKTTMQRPLLAGMKRLVLLILAEH